MLASHLLEISKANVCIIQRSVIAQNCGKCACNQVSTLVNGLALVQDAAQSVKPPGYCLPWCVICDKCGTSASVRSWSLSGAHVEASPARKKGASFVVVRFFSCDSRPNVAPLYPTKHKCVPRNLPLSGEVIKLENTDFKNAEDVKERGLSVGRINSEMRKMAFKIKKDQWTKKVKLTSRVRTEVKEPFRKKVVSIPPTPKLVDRTWMQSNKIFFESKSLRELKDQINKKKPKESEVGVWLTGTRGDWCQARRESSNGVLASEFKTKAKVETIPGNEEFSLPSPYFFIKQRFSQESLSGTFSDPASLRTSSNRDRSKAKVKEESVTSARTPSPRLLQSSSSQDRVTDEHALRRQIESALKQSLPKKDVQSLLGPIHLSDDSQTISSKEDIKSKYPSPNLKNNGKFYLRCDNAPRSEPHMLPVEVAVSIAGHEQTAPTKKPRPILGLPVRHEDCLRKSDQDIRQKNKSKLLLNEVVVKKEDKGSLDLSGKMSLTKDTSVREVCVAKLCKKLVDDLQKSSFSSLTHNGNVDGSHVGDASGKLFSSANETSDGLNRETTDKRLNHVPQNVKTQEHSAILEKSLNNYVPLLKKDMHSKSANGGGKRQGSDDEEWRKSNRSPKHSESVSDHQPNKAVEDYEVVGEEEHPSLEKRRFHLFSKRVVEVTSPISDYESTKTALGTSRGRNEMSRITDENVNRSLSRDVEEESGSKDSVSTVEKDGDWESTEDRKSKHILPIKRKSLPLPLEEPLGTAHLGEASRNEFYRDEESVRSVKTDNRLENLDSYTMPTEEETKTKPQRVFSKQNSHQYSKLPVLPGYLEMPESKHDVLFETKQNTENERALDESEPVLRPEQNLRQPVYGQSAPYYPSAGPRTIANNNIPKDVDYNSSHSPKSGEGYGRSQPEEQPFSVDDVHSRFNRRQVSNKVSPRQNDVLSRNQLQAGGEKFQEEDTGFEPRDPYEVSRPMRSHASAKEVHIQRTLWEGAEASEQPLPRSQDEDGQLRKTDFGTDSTEVVYKERAHQTADRQPSFEGLDSKTESNLDDVADDIPKKIKKLPRIASSTKVKLYPEPFQEVSNANIVKEGHEGPRNDPPDDVNTKADEDTKRLLDSPLKMRLFPTPQSAIVNESKDLERGGNLKPSSEKNKTKVKSVPKVDGEVKKTFYSKKRERLPLDIGEKVREHVKRNRDISLESEIRQSVDRREFEYTLAEESKRSFETLKNLIKKELHAHSKYKLPKGTRDVTGPPANTQQTTFNVKETKAETNASKPDVSHTETQSPVSEGPTTLSKTNRKNLRNSYYHLGKAKSFLETFIENVALEQVNVGGSSGSLPPEKNRHPEYDDTDPPPKAKAKHPEYDDTDPSPKAKAKHPEYDYPDPLPKAKTRHPEYNDTDPPPKAKAKHPEYDYPDPPPKAKARHPEYNDTEPPPKAKAKHPEYDYPDPLPKAKARHPEYNDTDPPLKAKARHPEYNDTDPPPKAKAKHPEYDYPDPLPKAKPRHPEYNDTDPLPKAKARHPEYDDTDPPPKAKARHPRDKESSATSLPSPVYMHSSPLTKETWGTTKVFSSESKGKPAKTQHEVSFKTANSNARIQSYYKTDFDRNIERISENMIRLKQWTQIKEETQKDNFYTSKGFKDFNPPLDSKFQTFDSATLNRPKLQSKNADWYNNFKSRYEVKTGARPVDPGSYLVNSLAEAVLPPPRYTTPRSEPVSYTPQPHLQHGPLPATAAQRQLPPLGYTSNSSQQSAPPAQTPENVSLQEDMLRAYNFAYQYYQDYYSKPNATGAIDSMPPNMVNGTSGLEEHAHLNPANYGQPTGFNMSTQSSLTPHAHAGTTSSSYSLVPPSPMFSAVDENKSAQTSTSYNDPVNPEVSVNRDLLSTINVTEEQSSSAVADSYNRGVHENTGRGERNQSSPYNPVAHENTMHTFNSTRPNYSHNSDWYKAQNMQYSADSRKSNTEDVRHHYEGSDRTLNANKLHPYGVLNSTNAKVNAHESTKGAEYPDTNSSPAGYTASGLRVFEKDHLGSRSVEGYDRTQSERSAYDYSGSETNSSGFEKIFKKSTNSSSRYLKNNPTNRSTKPTGDNFRASGIAEPPPPEFAYRNSVEFNDDAGFSLRDLPKNISGYFQKLVTWKDDKEGKLLEGDIFRDASSIRQSDSKDKNLTLSETLSHDETPFEKMTKPLTPIIDKINRNVDSYYVKSMFVDNPMKSMSKVAFARRANSGAKQDDVGCTTCMKISNFSSSLQNGVPFLKGKMLNYDFKKGYISSNGNEEEEVTHDTVVKGVKKDENRSDQVLFRNRDRSEKDLHLTYGKQKKPFKPKVVKTSKVPHSKASNSVKAYLQAKSKVWNRSKPIAMTKLQVLTDNKPNSASIDKLNNLERNFLTKLKINVPKPNLISKVKAVITESKIQTKTTDPDSKTNGTAKAKEFAVPKSNLASQTAVLDKNDDTSARSKELVESTVNTANSKEPSYPEALEDKRILNTAIESQARAEVRSQVEPPIKPRSDAKTDILASPAPAELAVSSRTERGRQIDGNAALKSHDAFPSKRESRTKRLVKVIQKYSNPNKKKNPYKAFSDLYSK